MKKVFIVGGNGFARECYYNLMLMQENDKNIQFGGFLGHGGYGHTVDYKDLQPYYIGEVKDYTFKKDEYAVIGAGYPELREKIYKELKARGINFFTIYTGKPLKQSVILGEANIIAPPLYCSCNIKIGDGNVFNGEVGLGHDVNIGNFNFFGPRSNILGETHVGNNNTIGASAILLPHSKIGNNNHISPISAVYKGCKNNCYMHGNPAIKIGNIEEEAID